MPLPQTILLVRFRSRLSREEIEEVVEERLPEFTALSGLQQKYYLEDPATGEYAGLYLWDSADALSEFNESELRSTIAEVYQIEGAPRIEVYQVIRSLR